MKIQVFNTLLKQKNPSANAMAFNGKVRITFCPEGTPYSYSGSIQQVAEKLNLVPQIDMISEAELAKAKFELGQTEVIAPTGMWDTLNHLNPPTSGNELHSEIVGVNEYGQKMSKYTYRKSLWV